MSPTGPQLSPREKEVLDLLAEGLGVSQISRRLFISDSTTKTHISKLYEKLGAGNRAQAIMAALRLGLIEPPETTREPITGCQDLSRESRCASPDRGSTDRPAFVELPADIDHPPQSSS